MSRAKSIGNVYAELSVRDKMTMGLAKAGKSLSKFGKQATRYAGAGLAAGTAAAGVALIAGTKRTLDMTDAVGDLAAQTGISVSGMMKMQQVYKDGGRSAEMASKDIGKMQKSIVTAAEGAVEDDPFAKIGLSARELIELAPEKQFKMIGDALMRIENPALRNARAMEIFGKGGVGLASVFGNAEKSVKSLGRMPELAEQFADRMGGANDIIGRLPVKSDQFFMGFTAGIIDEMLPALRQADEMDFTTFPCNSPLFT